MRHQGGRRGQQRGSAMGAYYRHTTPEMGGRIATAIEQRADPARLRRFDLPVPHT
jgi:hypothetical protein